MKRTFYILFLGLLLASMTNASESLTAKNELIIRDFEVMDIKFLEPIEKILKRFGEPLEIKSFYEDKYRTYVYSDFDIGCFSPGNNEYYIVDSILIKKRGYKTYRGISVGDKLKKVLYHYGEGNWVDKNVIDYQVWLMAKEEDFVPTPYGIYFTIKDNKVENFRVYLPID